MNRIVDWLLDRLNAELVNDFQKEMREYEPPATAELIAQTEYATFGEVPGTGTVHPKPLRNDKCDNA